MKPEIHSVQNSKARLTNSHNTQQFIKDAKKLSKPPPLKTQVSIEPLYVDDDESEPENRMGNDDDDDAILVL